MSCSHSGNASRRSSGIGGMNGDRAVGAGSGRLNGMILEAMPKALQVRCRTLIWLIYGHLTLLPVVPPREIR